MTSEQFRAFFDDVLITVHLSIKDLRERQAFADPAEQDYIAGRLASYQEVLATFRASARDTGLDPRELGL